ncbi:MAG: cyclohexanecarboxyl-CoA dehydrogenase [Betaproteobacteria bacterium]|nr:MAG: cyclohexanecarboxyl-CoA dehydrogenase [Betaproteobacteria bacterium]
MDFSLTPEQEAMRDLAARFAKEKLAPDYMKREKNHTIDRAILKEMGSLGLISMALPEKYGGMGVDCATSGLIIEQIAYGDFNISYVQLVSWLMGQILCKYAAPEVAQEWVPKLAAGESLVALGLTEPRGGSDAANLILRAEPKGDHYIINGEKTSVSFSEQADVIVAFARTGKGEDVAKGISAFVIPLNAPGVSRTRFSDLGTKIVGRGSVFFDNVKIPANHRMGEENRAFFQIMNGFDYSRALIGLQCLGAAQASLDEAWQYSTERKAFGAPIAQYQGVSFPLAEADTLLTAARALCYRTLWLRDKDLPHTAEAAMCKWWVPKICYEAIYQCLLTHGHYGYTTDLPHQQRMRDTLGLQIGDGTAQIMKLIIARERVGRVAVQYAQGSNK